MSRFLALSLSQNPTMSALKELRRHVRTLFPYRLDLDLQRLAKFPGTDIIQTFPDGRGTTHPDLLVNRLPVLDPTKGLRLTNTQEIANYKGDYGIIAAPPGTGKTRALFEFLCENWGLYFAVDWEYMSFDFAQAIFKTSVEVGWPGKTRLSEAAQCAWNLKNTKGIFERVAIARLLILERVLEVNQDLTPAQWLMLQLFPKRFLGTKTCSKSLQKVSMSFMKPSRSS